MQPPWSSNSDLSKDIASCNSSEFNWNHLVTFKFLLTCPIYDANISIWGFYNLGHFACSRLHQKQGKGSYIWLTKTLFLRIKRECAAQFKNIQMKVAVLWLQNLLCICIPSTELQVFFLPKTEVIQSSICRVHICSHRI